MPDLDQDILFALSAARCKPEAAVDILNAAADWTRDPDTPLADLLIQRGFITSEDLESIRVISKQSAVDETLQLPSDDQPGPDKTARLPNSEETVLLPETDPSDADTIRTVRMPNSEETIVLPESDQQTLADTVRMSDPDDPNATIVTDLHDDATTPGHISAVTETPGRYANEHEHSRGGMGRILLVHDTHLDRDIALKELLPFGNQPNRTPTPVQQSASILARFLQEAKITGQLEHPSIVPVYEMGYRKDGSIYYTMKLVRGTDLADAIHNTHSLRERLALVPHFVDLCNAIAYAHSRGVIHRDLKPANVMIGEFGETVVIDWGLAKVKDKEDIHAQPLNETVRAIWAGDDANKTEYGEIMGTPAYMPPEQAKGELDQIDERSDVYSLGAVLYEILTGKPPFHGTSARNTLVEVIESPLQPVAEISAEVPPDLAAICERALSKDPAERYNDASALATDIELFQSGKLVEAHSYSGLEIIRHYWNRYRWQISAGGIAFAIVVAFIAGYVKLLSDSQKVEIGLRLEAQDAQAIAEIERADAIRQRDIIADISARESKKLSTLVALDRLELLMAADDHPSQYTRTRTIEVRNASQGSKLGREEKLYLDNVRRELKNWLRLQNNCSVITPLDGIPNVQIAINFNDDGDLQWDITDNTGLSENTVHTTTIALEDIASPELLDPDMITEIIESIPPRYKSPRLDFLTIDYMKLESDLGKLGLSLSSNGDKVGLCILPIIGIDENSYLEEDIVQYFTYTLRRFFFESSSGHVYSIERTEAMQRLEQFDIIRAEITLMDEVDVFVQLTVLDSDTDSPTLRIDIVDNDLALVVSTWTAPVPEPGTPRNIWRPFVQDLADQLADLHAEAQGEITAVNSETITLSTPNPNRLRLGRKIMIHENTGEPVNDFDPDSMIIARIIKNDGNTILAVPLLSDEPKSDVRIRKGMAFTAI